MDQKKSGDFLKHLRKEKGLTQEQLAERFSVSSRTVSRWETGRNMPDVDILIELADFYHVDIREIINGEDKDSTSNCQPEETMKLVATYAAEREKRSHSNAAHIAMGILIAVSLSTLLFVGETRGILYGIIPENICNGILWSVYAISACLIVSYLRVHWWLEKPSVGPEKKVTATVISKEVKPGTFGAGRSKMGYSYVVTFATADGETLELFAYEIEFGGLKEGTRGALAYQGNYFVDFEENT